jgi:uncharacterized protein
MLRLDLSEIVRTVGMHQVYEINEAPYSDDDIEYISPVRGAITITNSGKLILARGGFDTAVELQCSRCLADVRQVIHADIEEQYTIAEVESRTHHDVVPVIVQDEENEVPEGLFDGPVMNANVLIRQAAILATPWSVLCSDDCKGLCAICGKNRNIGACKCAPDGTHRPFAALPELFRQEQSE